MNIPAFLGRRCRALVAREFWLSGALVSHLCAVFLTDDAGDSWQIYLDDEDHTWKVEQTDSAPHPGTVEGDAEFRYPAVDMLSDYAVEGLPIQGFVDRATCLVAEAEMEFAGGTSLLFRYEYATGKKSCVFEKATG
jgi:hypothetical protein